MIINDKLDEKGTRTPGRQQAEAQGWLGVVPRQPRSSGWWAPLVCGFSLATSAHSLHAYSKTGAAGLSFPSCSHAAVSEALLAFLKSKRKQNKNIEKDREGKFPIHESFWESMAVPKLTY